MNPPTKLNKLQKRTLKAVMAAGDVQEGLKVVGVQRVTWERWKGEQRFQEALRKAGEQAFSAMLETLERGTALAAEELLKLLHSPKEGVKLQAINLLLSLAPKVIKDLKLVSRIEALEKERGAQ